MCAQVLLRPAPGRVRADPELLPDGQTALPDGRVRAAVRGGARVLGPGLEPGGAVLLDDVHGAPRHAGRANHPRPVRLLARAIELPSSVRSRHRSPLLSCATTRLTKVETLRTLCSMDLDSEQPPEEELLRRFGLEEAVRAHKLTWWQRVRPRLWLLFDQPFVESRARGAVDWAKVRSAVAATALPHARLALPRSLYRVVAAHAARSSFRARPSASLCSTSCRSAR